MRVDVPLPQDQVLLGPDLDLEARRRARTGRGRPPRRCAPSGRPGSTSAQTRRRLTSAVAGIRIPARDFRSPSSSDGCTSRRSAAMRIDCLVVVVRTRPTDRSGVGHARQATADVRLAGCFDGRRTALLPSPRGGTPRRSGAPDGEAGADRTRRSGGELRRTTDHELRSHRSGVLPADQAAGHRAAARHHRAGDGPRRRRPPVARGSSPRCSSAAPWPPAAPTRSTAGSSATATADAAHARPPAARRATSTRPARWSSGSCSRSLAFALLWATVEPARRVARGERHALLRLRLHALAQAPQRRRTSSSAAPPARSRCSSAGPRSPARSPPPRG